MGNHALNVDHTFQQHPNQRRPWGKALLSAFHLFPSVLPLPTSGKFIYCLSYVSITVKRCYGQGNLQEYALNGGKAIVVGSMATGRQVWFRNSSGNLTLIHKHEAERELTWECWYYRNLTSYPLVTMSSSTRPQALILPTTNPNIQAYGGHSHSVQHSCPIAISLSSSSTQSVLLPLLLTLLRINQMICGKPKISGQGFSPV